MPATNPAAPRSALAWSRAILVGGALGVVAAALIFSGIWGLGGWRGRGWATAAPVLLGVTVLYLYITGHLTRPR